MISPVAQQTIYDAGQTTLAQFRAGQRTDYAALRNLLVLGIISEKEVAEIESAVTFANAGPVCGGQIKAGKWQVVEVIR